MRREGQPPRGPGPGLRRKAWAARSRRAAAPEGGATTPTVVLEGPTTLEPGATGQGTFIIQGGPAKTGGVDLTGDSADANLQAGTGTKKLGAELTHSAPRAFTGNALRFNFSLVAPAKDVTLTLFRRGQLLQRGPGR